MIASMYQALRPFRSEFVPIREHSYHVHNWGHPKPGVPPLVMVHGWMDVGASFQFVVDALRDDRHVIAPDWRGFGLTTGPVVDNYWFPDYLADLDLLLDHYAGDVPVDLVGHSMGGNVVMQYAGVRPERIRRLVNLEGFGGPQNRPAQAPGRYVKWIDELKAFHRGDKDLRGYATVEGVAKRLMKTNPRLAQDQADWLARHWAREDADGQWQILGDPAHKIVLAQLTRIDEVLALYQRITAPTLAVNASDDTFARYWPGQYSLAEFHERLKQVPDVRTAAIADAGHMLHHDQPAALARLIEDFLV
ncbi:MAG: alpha/beta hydrolase [Rhodoferax sp.]|nr:alpha/beta hydrolase [Rhodoferax sp.]